MSILVVWSKGAILRPSYKPVIHDRCLPIQRNKISFRFLCSLDLFKLSGTHYATQKHRCQKFWIPGENGSTDLHCSDRYWSPAYLLWSWLSNCLPISEQAMDSENVASPGQSPKLAVITGGNGYICHTPWLTLEYWVSKLRKDSSSASLRIKGMKESISS